MWALLHLTDAREITRAEQNKNPQPGSLAELKGKGCSTYQSGQRTEAFGKVQAKLGVLSQVDVRVRAVLAVAVAGGEEGAQGRLLGPGVVRIRTVLDLAGSPQKPVDKETGQHLVPGQLEKPEK